MIEIDDKSTPPSYDPYDPADEDLDPPPYDASVSRALTAHEYSIKPKPHTEITLTLDSHSPAPDKLPLYYPPDQITGTVQLRLERTFGFKNITISLQGGRATNSEIIPGQRGEFAVFYETSFSLPLSDWASPASLGTEPKGKSTTYRLSGTHVGAFILDIPGTYSEAKKVGGGSWTKNLFGAKKLEAARAEGAEKDDVRLPLPPSTLRSQVDPAKPEMYQYSVVVSCETEAGHDNYSFSKQVILLPRLAQAMTGDVKVAPGPVRSSSSHQ